MTTTTLIQKRQPGGQSLFSRVLIPVLAMLAMLGISQSAAAQTFFNNAITLTQQPTGAASSSVNYAGKRTDAPYNTYTRLGNSNASPPIAAPNAGTYDLNTTSGLSLNAATLVVSPPARGQSFVGAHLMYRVYLTSTTPVPNYSQVTLSQTGTDSFGDPIFTTTGNNINLLSGLTSGGNYSLEVQFVLDVSDGSNVTPVIDPSGSNGYTVSFYVTPPPTTPAGGTTTWQGVSRGPNGTTLSGDTEWLNIANWSNGVPTSTSNAIIPPKSNSAVVYPILNDPNAPYAVNNLTLQGNTGSSAAQLVINAATLSVYGNLFQPGGGLSGNITGPGSASVGVTNSQTNSTLIFAGADQIITGQLLVSDIIIAGSGIKSVINVLIPANILAFQPASVANGVLLQSAAQDLSSGSVQPVFDTTGNSYIQLVSSSTISLVPGQAETNVSYIKGVTRADRTLTAGVQNTFGNIGLDITANHTPGSIFVYRVVGDALTGPVNQNAVPIKRQYKIVGDDNSESASTAASNIDIVFHYLDSPDELNGIMESNLTMFRSKVNGAPYMLVSGVLNAANNTITRLGLPSLTTSFLTLGDRTNPLPVSLTAFTVARSGADAVLNWTTASEKNNTGFEVQVSTDGANFRKLAFVATQNANSSQKLTYAYTDIETGKTGVRYYRLRQIDTDETAAFSPVRTVSFNGTASAATALAGYPNPFSNKLDFNLDATTVGNGVAHIQLVDMTGRIVREQDLKVANASLTLNDLDGLRSGLYLAKVTLPDGTTQKVRVQKQ